MIINTIFSLDWAKEARKRAVRLVRFPERRVEPLLHPAWSLADKAKPVFAACGIPGTVGSGSRALWSELAPLLQSSRSFRIWPFDGKSVEELLATSGIVLAEVYPRAAYATALAPELPTVPVRLAKTKGPVRENTLDRLAVSAWVQEKGIQLLRSDEARKSEDDFDALLTALLRCVLEKEPLFDPRFADPVEGGILGTGTIHLPCVTRDASGNMEC